jgi:hypothetical protein
MKHLFLLAVTSLSLMACATTTVPVNHVVVSGHTYNVPVGYQPCRSGYDCHGGQFCGFMGVGTVSVCRY